MIHLSSENKPGKNNLIFCTVNKLSFRLLLFSALSEEMRTPGLPPLYAYVIGEFKYIVRLPVMLKFACARPFK